MSLQVTNFNSLTYIKPTKTKVFETTSQLFNVLLVTEAEQTVINFSISNGSKSVYGIG